MNEQKCRVLVRSRADGLCERCGNTSRGLTIHHRKKRSQGGGWDLTNCVLVCGHGTTPDGCHSWAEHNPNAAELEGYHVRPWQDPGDIPVKILGEWYLLLPDGEKRETTRERDLATGEGELRGSGEASQVPAQIKTS